MQYIINAYHYYYYYIVILLYRSALQLLDMTRQYKAMQNEMSLRIQQLEADLVRTRLQHGRSTPTIDDVIFLARAVYFLASSALLTPRNVQRALRGLQLKQAPR